MSLYQRLKATASRLLQRQGQPMTLVRRTPGAYDAAAGSVVLSSATETGVGVALDYRDTAIDGSMIQRGDQRILLAQIDGTPAIGDTLLIDDEPRKVINVKRTAPAGLVVMWELQVRQ